MNEKKTEAKNRELITDSEGVLLIKQVNII